MGYDASLEAGSHFIVILTLGKMDYLSFGTEAFGVKPEHVFSQFLATNENVHICQNFKSMLYSDYVLIYSPSEGI